MEPSVVIKSHCVSDDTCSSDAKVAEVSTPEEAPWLRASCRKVAGDSDNSEDDIISGSTGCPKTGKLGISVKKESPL